MELSNVMLLGKKKENCCGCAACEAICLKDAIRMQLDENGFYYPEIAMDRCVGCGRCVAVCPMK